MSVILDALRRSRKGATRAGVAIDPGARPHVPAGLGLGAFSAPVSGSRSARPRLLGIGLLLVIGLGAWAAIRGLVRDVIRRRSRSTRPLLLATLHLRRRLRRRITSRTRPRTRPRNRSPRRPRLSCAVHLVQKREPQGPRRTSSISPFAITTSACCITGAARRRRPSSNFGGPSRSTRST